jgi:hypothetical protein
VPYILDVNDCPLHNVVHDIALFPKYYDPIYHPHCYPEIFETPMTVKDWIESALKSHASACHGCLSKGLSFGIRFSVQWRGSYFVVCSFLNGKLNQCTVSLEDLESHYYTHCWLLSRLRGKCSSLNSRVLSTAPSLPLENANVFNIIANKDPTWLCYSNASYRLRLSQLSVSILADAVKSCSLPSSQVIPRKKEMYISKIVDHFISERNRYILTSRAKFSSTPRDNVCSFVDRMEHLYGQNVAALLREPPFAISSQLNRGSFPFDELSYQPELWFNETVDELIRKLNSFTIESIVSHIKKIPVHRRPTYSTTSRRKTLNSLVDHVLRRVSYLFSLKIAQVCELILALDPRLAFEEEPSRDVMINKAVGYEYGPEIYLCLSSPSLSINDRRKFKRRQEKDATIQCANEKVDAYEAAWPTQVSQAHIFECLNAYREGTVWKEPPICAICGQTSSGVKVVFFGGNASVPPPFSLDILQITDKFIIENCIVKCNSAEFVFGSNIFDGLMLDKAGISKSTLTEGSLNCCPECHASMRRNKIPRMALANNLYRGVLPAQFEDLTWVEEMVCAIYRNTAHITRLYGSSDPANPTVLHGNTCAHDMNLVSTASVLPRTPADINGMLSVVFVGAGKFEKKSLQKMFRIRKHKVWEFLLWLRSHNRLYATISLDLHAMNLYPDDGFLPGIEDRIIQDNEISAETIFLEETAGFLEHPAELFRSATSNLDNDTSIAPGEDREDAIFIERTGVVDPESVRLSGRSFTTSALRNLAGSLGTGQMGNDSDQPDLAIHHGAAAVSEYNNPDLMPGMFPTLFPFGIGGFEDKSRPTALSFKEQAQYYFNISDRAFRYHFSYIFVALNMLQRRLAHLHTYFTVKKNNFDSIARKLVAVSPDILNDLAKHLEQEKQLSDLSTGQKDALELLKKVNTISARIPGSQASKIFIRNEIRSYFGFFALPHLFFTFNTSAAHSPIFQVMFGDKTIDLSSRFPKTVPGQERALRLAKDPVAAADFFEFSVTCLFKFLLGWDYSTSSSTEHGGILGKIRAFYGTSEFTERGSLHGHFLIWLVGGLNPTDLHARLADNTRYQKQFFDYFESIIYHHLPEIEVDLPPTYEPRVERPPVAPSPSATQSENPAIEILKEWNSVFCTEVKKCGEVLQRHVCRPVCHKYGNEGKCRFLFPHEIVEASYFDPETNSVFLLCRDGSVNYFNPYILIFCRHNHDLKCILSGKSAKAAMFYITDYITKMDCKTYEMLSLLSRVVSRMPDIVNSSPTDGAKILLHKCISQFTRQQQIHAQQAVRYLRGFGDGIPSHKTVPMMSALLLSFIKANFQPGMPSPASESRNDEEDDDVEELPLKIVTDDSGELVDTHQVHHYWHRNDSLAHMSFYDFCRCIRIEKKSRTSHIKNTHETRLGVLHRHTLKSSHPLHETHQLIEHTNEMRGEGHHELVPRVVGMSIPRETSAIWPLFVLAHFKPFSITQPLIPSGDSCDNIFRTYSFSDRSFKVIKNWNATHECEDERDAERLRKRAAATRESAAMTASVAFPELNDEDIENTMTVNSNAERDFRVQQAIFAMRQSNWLKLLPEINNLDVRVSGFSASVQDSLPDITDSLMKRWKAETKTQEQVISNQRRNVLNPQQQAMSDVPINVSETQMLPILSSTTGDGPLLTCPPTKALHVLSTNINEQLELSAQDILLAVEQEFSLNIKQVQAFRIIAHHFLKKFIVNNPTEMPLRMLMTGPGGTGKTHVVKALKKVMKSYGCEHKIRFLAPTGSAASLIDGMTIHKGLGIKIIKTDGRGKGTRAPGESKEDYTVLVSIKNKTQLRDEWRNVDIVLVDEASLLSAQLLCEIDHALRYAKERPNEWFGGVTMIFAGDFYQYPPVVGTALYTPILMYAGQSNDEIQRRLGRMAWKTVDTVVELSEQQRMKHDPEYASAVQRLRTRQCHLEDMELFNSRLMKSTARPDGIDMGTAENCDAAAIVNTNLLREVLNMEKARSVCSQTGDKLVLCAARDIPSSPDVLSRVELEQILRINFSSSKHQGALPGFLPLFVGMPVILRMRNLSTDLKITNGAQGYVRKVFLDDSPQGLTSCSCAIVEFPDSPVKLEGLPQGYFPITPVTFSFTASLTRERDGKIEKLKFSRHQLPIQPGFAVTGHSAQGKTLPKVLANLHEGGFGAYVAASRAKSRTGLCITQTVRLNDLNKPVPHDLFVEVRRLEILEKNTLVRHRFMNGTLLPVPDPESEIEITKQTVKIKVVGAASSSSKKRKMDDRDDSCSGANTAHALAPASNYNEGKIMSAPNLVSPDNNLKRRKKQANPSILNPDTEKKKKRKIDEKITICLDQKRQKKRLLVLDPSTRNSNPDTLQKYGAESNSPSSLYASARPLLLSAGCSWTAENWSCAYDSVFMSLYGVYATSSPQIRRDFISISALANSLVQSFEVLSLPLSHTTSVFNHQRDNLRDSLSAVDPEMFRRVGQIGASVSAIIDIVFPSSTRQLIILPSCPRRCSFIQSFSESLSDNLNTFPSVMVPPEMRIGGGTQNSVHLDAYISDFITKASQNREHLMNFPNQTTCRECSSTFSGASAVFLKPPPLLFFEVPAEAGLSVCSVLPSPYIKVPSLHCQVSYRLAAVIYLGGYHFTCRLVMNDYAIWKYDGQIDNGRPCPDVHAPSFPQFLSEMLFLGTRKAHFYIYARVDE